MLYSFLKLIGYILFKLFFKIRFFGQQYVPEKGPAIIASNHLSYLDPIVLGLASPRALNFMAKRGLFRNRLFAYLISNVGAFPVARGSLGDVGAVKEAIKRLNQDKVLIIFPEGSRSSDGKLKTPLAGIGMLAAKVNCPIIPAYIRGTDKALPLNAKFIKFFRPISVRFGRKVERNNIGSKKDYQIFSNKVMAEISKLAECS